VIDPGQIAALVDAGGWTLFVATVIVIAVAVQRQILVPGWIYRREYERNVELRKSLATLARAFARLKRDA
jgi:hypothetical protein